MFFERISRAIIPNDMWQGFRLDYMMWVTATKAVHINSPWYIFGLLNEWSVFTDKYRNKDGP